MTFIFVATGGHTLAVGMRYPPPPDVDSVVSTEFLRGAKKDVRNLEVPEVTGDVCSPPQGCYPTS